MRNKNGLVWEKLNLLPCLSAQESFTFYFQVNRAGLSLPAELSEAFFECRERPVGNISNTTFIFIFSTEKDQTLKKLVIAF